MYWPKNVRGHCFNLLSFISYNLEKGQFKSHVLRLNNLNPLLLVICQWAIFAIRNILENNKENQDIVSSMDPRGLADASRLRQFGVEAVELDGGRIKLVPIK